MSRDTIQLNFLVPGESGESIEGEEGGFSRELLSGQDSERKDI